jgi:hypothetical protein
MRSLYFITILSVCVLSCNHKREQRALFPIKEFGKWGYIDGEGKHIIDCKFDYATRFSEGLAAVKIDSLWGFIDENGEMAIAPKFFYPDGEETTTRSFSDGLCAVQLRTDSAIVNVFIRRDGNIAFVSPFDSYWNVSDFQSGRARVDIEDEICFINKKGEVVIRTGFPYGWRFHDGIGQVWSEDSTHYIDSLGHVILALSGMGHGKFEEGVALVTNGPNYYVTADGHTAVTSAVGDFVHFDFSDSLARVYDLNLAKSGFIDRSGKIAIPIRYDDAGDFKEGLCAVADGRWGFIDKRGEVVINPRFEAVDRGGFYQGVCWVKEERRWGYINREGSYIWREQLDVKYEKTDLSKWDLDTLSVTAPMVDHSFESYDNFPRSGNFESTGTFYLKVDTVDLTPYADRYYAFKLYLINATKDTVRVPAQDAKLKMIQQAINSKGEWQDVDNFINSFCGHSYYSYDLLPGEYQIFSAPFFKGPYKTKFRFKLEMYKDSIFSNTYVGYMHESQFLDPEDRDRAGISVLANF